MTSYHITPDETGVCRVETDPGFVDMIRDAAKKLRAAKEAHTAWEARFEGSVPEHDWEVWYAQHIAIATMAAIGHPTVPCSITKLGTLVGPLE